MTKPKRPADWTTKEAVRHLFPKRLADALEQEAAANTEPDDPTPDKPKRHSTRKER